VLRIVGGCLGGRQIRLRVPPGTRPTTGLVREAIFAGLESRGALRGARVLDLYGGTGALSLEALSRGAAVAHWVEREVQLARQLRRVSEEFGIADRLVLHVGSVERFLDDEARRLEIDLILLDPPYGAIDLARLGERLPRAQLVVVEADAPASLGPRWSAWRWRRYGGTHVGFFVPVGQERGQPDATDDVPEEVARRPAREAE